MTISAKLLEKVPSDWWASDDGARFKKQDQMIDSWVSMLDEKKYDCFFTLTYREPASSSILAIDRGQRLLRRYFKSLKFRLDAFVVAEQHKSGLYHCHGLLKIPLTNETNVDLFLTGLWKIGYEKFGRCSFQKIVDPERVRKYIAKYLLKDGGDWRFVP